MVSVLNLVKSYWYSIILNLAVKKQKRQKIQANKGRKNFLDHPIRDLYQAPPTNMSQRNSANKSAEFLFMSESETSKMTQMSQTPAKMSQEASRPIR